MKILKGFVIAGMALVVSMAAFAGRDEAQMRQQERAMKQKQAEQGRGGPTGKQGKIGPGTKSSPRSYDIGHPTERVRR